MDGTSNKPYVSGVEKISKNWKKKKKSRQNNYPYKKSHYKYR